MATHSGESLERILKQFPCHFDWNLEENTDKDIRIVVHHLDNHLKYHKDRVPGPAKTFRGYLCVSSLNPPGEKDPLEALRWFDDALGEFTGDAEGEVGNLMVTLANKARTLLLLGDTEKAWGVTIELLRKKDSLKCEKTEAYMYVNEGFSLSWLGASKFDRGVECYKNALKVFPRKEEWLFGHAMFLGKTDAHLRFLDQEQGALKQEKLLRKILRINPSNAFARVNLAKNLAGRDSDIEAMFHYERALEDGGGEVTVVQRVAEHYHWKGKFVRAIATFKSALELDPQSAFIHQQLGSIYKKIAKTKGRERARCLLQAIEHFDKAIALDGTRYGAMRDRVQVYTDLNGNAEARRLYEQLIRETDARTPQASDAHLNFAKYLERLNRKSEKLKAIEHYKKALAAYPDCRSGQEAAKILLERKLKELSENPMNAEALRLIGWIYAEIGHLDTACFYYEKAYAVDSTDFVAFKLAELFHKTNNALKKQEYLNSVQHSDDEESEPVKIVSYHIQNGGQHEEMFETEKARKEYATAAEYMSLKGSENLVKILKHCDDSEKFKPEWFSDCAKISYNIKNKSRLIERKRGGSNSKLNARVRQLEKNLEEIAAPTTGTGEVRHLYTDYMTVFGEVPISDTSREYPHVIQNARVLLRNASRLLHKCVSEFEQLHYHIYTQNKFFYVGSGGNSVPAEVKKTIERYGWKDFPNRFGKLFMFLVEIQPGYNPRQNGWLEKLLSRFDADHSGMALAHKFAGLGVGDGGEGDEIFDLAKEAVVKTVQIAREFHKYVGVDDDDYSSSDASDDGVYGAQARFF